MNKFRSGRVAAIISSLLASFIWASSFVFVKMILSNIGPLTIAGLRYFLAFLILLPFMISRKQALKSISPKTWSHLVLIGISAYAIGNGALFWALKYLSATTTSLLMSVIPFLVLFAGVIFLKELPSVLQVVGLIVSLIGSALFFYSGFSSGEPLGIAILAIALIGFTAFGILGRGLAKDNRTGTIFLTGIPFGIGGIILLLVAIPLEGWPVFNLKVLLIMLLLTLINTVAAYMLYNYALKTITAFEMNMFLNLSPLGTAALAWFFLGESLTLIQLFGVAVVIIGVTLVQVKRKNQKGNTQTVEISTGRNN